MTLRLLPSSEKTPGIEGEFLPREDPPWEKPSARLYFEGCPVDTHPLFAFRPGVVRWWRIYAVPSATSATKRHVLRCQLTFDTTRSQRNDEVWIDVPLPCMYFKGDDNITEVDQL